MAADLTRTAAQEFASLAGAMDATGLGERVGLRAMEVIAELHDTKDKDVEQLTVDAALSTCTPSFGR